MRGGHPLCVELKRRLAAMTSLGFALLVSPNYRISFKKNSDNLIWKASAAAVDKLVVKGSSPFLAVRVFLRD